MLQGDRKAGPSLSAFNYESTWGQKALKRFYRVVLGVSPLRPVALAHLRGRFLGPLALCTCVQPRLTMLLLANRSVLAPGQKRSLLRNFTRYLRKF